jgi:hypothetical protein
MLPKYTIEYTNQFKKYAQTNQYLIDEPVVCNICKAQMPQSKMTNHYSTDDPVACEEFVEELLERGFVIRAIKHEGVELPKQDFDKLVKTAAGMLASKQICASLGIKPEEQHYRFGFAC